MSDVTSQYQQVKEFMTTFGQEVPEKPTIPSLEVRKLRAKLILEEALEAIDGLGIACNVTIDGYCVKLDINRIGFGSNLNFNQELLADGLADLHYVGYLGTAIACGISNMDEIFNEVHRSNMSKLWTEEDMKTTHTLPNMFTTKQIGNKWLVKDKDGKVIKSPSYSPAYINVK